MAMYYSLEKRKAFVLQVHSLRPEETSIASRPRSWSWAYHNVIRPKRRCELIVAVRDPLRMMITEYFSKLRWITSTKDAVHSLSTNELCNLFRTAYIEKDKRHQRILNWIDEEMKAATGIDVYSVQFPHDKRYVQFNHDNLDVLVIRTELDDITKGQIVGDFLGMKDLVIERHNTAEQKNIGSITTAFRDQLKLPRSILEEIYGSHYAMHFLSADEREQAIRHYLLPD
jgi:hypothetical protein